MKANYDNLTDTELEVLVAQQMSPFVNSEKIDTQYAAVGGMVRILISIDDYLHCARSWSPSRNSNDLENVKREIEKAWCWKCEFSVSYLGYIFYILEKESETIFESGHATTEGRACLIAFLRAIKETERLLSTKEQTNESES